MGDLVRSEQTLAPQHLHDRFNTAVAHQNEQHPHTIVAPLTITLGDEFQGLLRSLVDAASIARAIRFRLLDQSIDCRFAIGTVVLRTPLNTDRAWNMMGPGLAATRARLTDKRDSSFYRFAFPQYPFLQTMLDASGATLTAIEQSWTDTQRADIGALLGGATPAEIAARRKVSVHTIYKVRATGSYDLYQTQWHAMNTALAELDHLYTTPEADDTARYPV